MQEMWEVDNPLQLLQASEAVMGYFHRAQMSTSLKETNFFSLHHKFSWQEKVEYFVRFMAKGRKKVQILSMANLLLQR